MTVIVQLRGGLGNQLFQYAAGYALSARHGTELLLDTALLPAATVDRGGVRRWPEQISSFAHVGMVFDSTGGSPIRKRIAQSLGGRERALGDSRLRGLIGDRVYARETREDVDAFERLPAHARINAYCNSWRYFADASSDVSRQITTVVTPAPWYLQSVAAIDADQPIALHVRWGDYLNLAHVYGVIGAGYYRRAIERVASAIGTRPVWLFSDDPTGALEMLGSTINVDHVVRPPLDSSPLENLLLLSRAAGIVAANSSFSWWAAFLSPARPGAVVFPRPLFAASGPVEPKDWLRADWMQVGRD